MDLSQNIEARIWEYLDGAGNTEERTVVEKLIAEQQEWKIKYAEIFEFHQMLMDAPADAPSLRFTMNVMDDISRVQIAGATNRYINKNIIRGIGLFFCLLIACIVIYAFGIVNWSDPSDSINIPVKIDAVDYSSIFSGNVINIFLFINVILGLFLADRYFSMRRDMDRAGNE